MSNGGEAPLVEPMTYAGRSSHVGTYEGNWMGSPLIGNFSTFPQFPHGGFSGMNGPRASKRVFLYELSCLPADTKVRFLGWYVLFWKGIWGNLVLNRKRSILTKLCTDL